MTVMQMDIVPIARDDGNGLDDSPNGGNVGVPPADSDFGPILTLKQPLSLDEDDPFRDFEEIDDSRVEIKTTILSGSVQKVNPKRNLSNSGGREQMFSKFKDVSEEDDSGVDMDVETFVAKCTEYSYVNNKIMEITSVKREAERSKEQLKENPMVVHALFDILTAKQQQIQRASSRDKISQHDHKKLIESLDAVSDLLQQSKTVTH